jgi:hypothetical protein
MSSGSTVSTRSFCPGRFEFCYGFLREIQILYILEIVYDINDFIWIFASYAFVFYALLANVPKIVDLPSLLLKKCFR